MEGQTKLWWIEPAKPKEQGVRARFFLRVASLSTPLHPVHLYLHDLIFHLLC